MALPELFTTNPDRSVEAREDLEIVCLELLRSVTQSKDHPIPPFGVMRGWRGRIMDQDRGAVDVSINFGLKEGSVNLKSVKNNLNLVISGGREQMQIRVNGAIESAPKSGEFEGGYAFIQLSLRPGSGICHVGDITNVEVHGDWLSNPEQAINFLGQVASFLRSAQYSATS